MYQRKLPGSMYMERFSGKKIKTCIFISGRGSNLKAIIESSKKRNFPAKIVLIISDKLNARGLNYLKKNKIPYKVYDFKNNKVFEKKSLIQLKKRKIKLLCLAGFMKILSSSFIKKFNYKIINIHPSLLPKYKGLNTHERVLEKKEKYSGCTVHYVTSKLDSGKIILQKKVKIKKGESENSLKKRILKQEHLLYSRAIKLVLK